jgi:hypothetical protein
MALFLDEIWLKDPSPDRAREFTRVIELAHENPVNLEVPAETKMIAGPWASNEENKILFVVDMPNHTATFHIFSRLVAQGLIERRRLTPIVDWGEVEKEKSQW